MVNSRGVSRPGRPTKKPITHTERRIYDEIKARARHMRKHPTRAEDALWQRLRKRQIQGLRFRRQHAIGPFIVDFCCVEVNLVIEVDGSIHAESAQAEYDIERQDYLESLGLRVLRFKNEELIHNTDDLVQAIETWLAQHVAKTPLPYLAGIPARRKPGRRKGNKAGGIGKSAT